MNRIRGRRLQRIRQSFLSEYPLCKKCKEKGKTRPAVEVDHIIPLFKGGADDWCNLQGLCLTCHQQKTREDLGLRPKGCDVNGIPYGV